MVFFFGGGSTFKNLSQTINTKDPAVFELGTCVSHSWTIALLRKATNFAI